MPSLTLWAPGPGGWRNAVPKGRLRRIGQAQAGLQAGIEATGSPNTTGVGGSRSSLQVLAGVGSGGARVGKDSGGGVGAGSDRVGTGAIRVGAAGS